MAKFTTIGTVIVLVAVLLSMNQMTNNTVAPNVNQNAVNVGDVRWDLNPDDFLEWSINRLGDRYYTDNGVVHDRCVGLNEEQCKFTLRQGELPSEKQDNIFNIN